MCANIAAQLYPLGIQAMPNVQVAHEEIQKITTTLGDLNHGVKRNDFRFPGSAQRFRVLCKMAVLFVRCKVLISGLGLGAVQDPVFLPDFKHWILKATSQNFSIHGISGGSLVRVCVLVSMHFEHNNFRSFL